MKLNQIVIVFDGMPGPTMPRFVEVEDGQGRSILAGTWRQRNDGKAELVIQNDDAGDGTSLRASARNAVMYLASGFIECPRCGHEVETKDTDAEYELRGALGIGDIIDPPDDVIFTEAQPGDEDMAQRAFDKAKARTLPAEASDSAAAAQSSLETNHV